MSDVFEGPGWWMASDGKWYSPELHPDPNYKAHFISPEPTPAASERPSTPSAALGHNQAHKSDHFEQPQQQANGEAVEHAIQAPVAAMDAHVVDPVVQVPIANTNGVSAEPAVEAPVAGAESHVVDPPTQVRVSDTTGISDPTDALQTEPKDFKFRVSKDPEIDIPERPTFAPHVPPSVVAPQQIPTPMVTRHTINPDVQVELDSRNTQSAPGGGLTLGMQKPATDATTDLVVVEPPMPRSGVALRDRITAAIIFIAGVGVIVGSFLEWTTGTSPETGWERGVGIITVVAGVVAAAAAGPILVGLHRVIPQVAAIISALVSLVVIGLVVIDTFDSGTQVQAAETGLGPGLIAVGAAAAAIILAAITSRSELV